MNWESLNRQNQQTDDAEARADFWSVQGDFIHRHHNETRVQLYVPKEKTFPIPLKHIDVTRSTHTDLDVMQEKHVELLLECRFEQKLVRFVERFHEVYPTERKNSQTTYVVRKRRLTKVQTTTRPDHVCPEVWTKNCKAAQNREKQEWKNEEPKLDNARRLRGNYFTDPDDQDHKETLKNARIKLEGPMAATLSCKKKAQTSTTKVAAKQEIAPQKIPETIYGCNVESQESTRPRVESSLPTKHEDHIAGKGFTSRKKSRARRRLFSKHKETKRKSTLLH